MSRSNRRSPVTPPVACRRLRKWALEGEVADSPKVSRRADRLARRLPRPVLDACSGTASSTCGCRKRRRHLPLAGRAPRAEVPQVSERISDGRLGVERMRSRRCSPKTMPQLCFRRGHAPARKLGAGASCSPRPCAYSKERAGRTGVRGKSAEPNTTPPPTFHSKSARRLTPGHGRTCASVAVNRQVHGRVIVTQQASAGPNLSSPDEERCPLQPMKA